MLPISVIPHLDSPVESVPEGWEVRRVLDWSSPVMNSYGYDVSRGGGGDVGQFQVVTCFVWSDTVGNWAGQWSAISNYNRMTGADLRNVARLQLLEWGYPATISDADLIAMKDKPLQDGYTLQQKMGWLYQPLSEGGSPGLEMWGFGEWWNAIEARYGAMVNGGQLVLVRKLPRTFRVKMPNRSTVESVSMRELRTFRRADFGMPHALKPYITQWATVANMGNVYGEYIRGHVAVPVALDPRDFDFSGSFHPTGYFLPEVWLDLK